jgi:hypothetical protein
MNAAVFLIRSFGQSSAKLGFRAGPGEFEPDYRARPMAE